MKDFFKKYKVHKMKHYLMLLFIMLFVVNLSAQKTDIEYNYAIVISDNIEKPLTLENIQKALVEVNVNFRPDVLNRIIIESGNLKSRLTTLGNNLFGMRKAGARPTTALPKKLYGYATYRHWIYSIIDYKLWEEYNSPRTYETYKSYLRRRHWN